MIKERMRRFVVYWIVVPLFIISGCTKGPGKVSEKSKVTAITFYYGAGPEEYKSYQKVFSSFEEKYPGIKIKENYFGGGRDYYTKLLTQIAGNVAPDIIFIQDMKIRYFVEKGILEDITPYLGKDTSYNIDDFYPKAIGAFTFNNKVYGIPKDMGPLVLYYNKDMFDKEKVPYPDSEWTWEDLVEYGKKLTKFDENGRPIKFALASAGWWHCFVRQNNGEIFNKEGTRCLLDTPQAIEALKFVRDLSLKYKIAPTPSQEREFSRGEANFFQSGKAAMSIHGRWMTPAYRKAKVNFDVAHLPKGKRRSTLLHISGFAILSSSKHKEETWKFLSFLTGKEGERIMTETGLLVPPRKSIAESETFLSITPPFNNQVFLDAMNYGEALWLNPGYTRCPGKWYEFTQTLELVGMGGKDPEAVIPEAVLKLNRELQRR